MTTLFGVLIGLIIVAIFCVLMSIPLMIIIKVNQMVFRTLFKPFIKKSSTTE